MSSPEEMSISFAPTAEQFASLPPREARRKYLILRLENALWELSLSRIGKHVDFFSYSPGGEEALCAFEAAFQKCVEGEAPLSLVMDAFKKLVMAYTDLRDRSNGSPQLPDITEYAT